MRGGCEANFVLFDGCYCVFFESKILELFYLRRDSYMDYGEPKVYFEVYGTLIYEIFELNN